MLCAGQVPIANVHFAWPMPSTSWSEEDGAKAQSYRACTDVVIWTPGVSSGNPISLNLLPDFAAIDNADEREQAINMAWATLVSFLPGSGEKATRKKGVLADAIRRFAIKSGTTLTDLIALLADLPDGVSEDSTAQKLASEIADQLRAAIAMNPLLRSIGEPLDPRTLFESPSGKTRISVINLCGLASEEARDSFVNRLQMALFTFIKRNPSPRGRLYVIDEAQNFAPSGAGTACKASTLSLVAQSRKYGLGMIFATQTPKGIDNKIVSNCTTHSRPRMHMSSCARARTRTFRKLTVTNRLRNSLPRCKAMTAQGKRCATVASRYHHPALAVATHKNNRIATRRYWAARRLAESVGATADRGDRK